MKNTRNWLVMWLVQNVNVRRTIGTSRAYFISSTPFSRAKNNNEGAIQTNKHGHMMNQQRQRLYIFPTLENGSFNRDDSIIFQSQTTTSSSFPTRRFLSSSSYDSSDVVHTKSVSGMIYSQDGGDSNAPKINVKLFTKEGCTLCDKVKEVLEGIREDIPHSLEAVDITDSDKKDYFSKYKYDIPVLHINNLYWTKHRLSKEQAKVTLEQAQQGLFLEPMPGEPNAGAMEHKK